MQSIIVPMLCFVVILGFPIGFVIIDMATLKNSGNDAYVKWKIAQQYLQIIAQLLAYLFICTLCSAQSLKYLNTMVQNKQDMDDAYNQQELQDADFSSSVTAARNTNKKTTARLTCGAGLILVLLYMASFVILAGSMIVHITELHILPSQNVTVCIVPNWIRESLVGFAYLFAIVPSICLLVFAIRDMRAQWSKKQ